MKYRIIIMAAAAALAVAGCTKEQLVESTTGDGTIITATATVPGAACQTKVSYTDAFKTREDIVDIKAAWEDGDTFTALEINGSTITEVKFTAKGAGKDAVFTSKGAVAADDNTSWISVFGDVEVVDGSFVCKYDNQDGTLANLSKYDFTVAKATGKTPKFDFAKGERLSYVMRVLLPEGIATMEFNTGEVYDGGWTVTSAGKAKGTTSTPVKEAVKYANLKSASTAGQIAYLSIPAISYAVGDGDSKNRIGGFILTIMSSDKKLSQGKVMSSDLSASGGCLGTFDMSTLTLMPRPLASDAIKMGSVTVGGVSYPLGSWAPFNLGADYPTSDDCIKGGMFAWGETEPKTTFTKDGYRFYNSGTYTTQIGYKYETPAEGVAPYIYLSPSGSSSQRNGPGTYYDICGTKYDAARVKWGVEWCLPTNDVVNNICEMGGPYLNEEGGIEYEYYSAGTYKNKYNFTSPSMGVCVYKANGQELALYFTPFTDDGKIDSTGSLGRYYTATSDYGVYSNGEFKGYWNRAAQLRMANNSCYINNKSWQWDGLAIRPILNEK